MRGECSLQIPGICQWFAATADGRLACRMCHEHVTRNPKWSAEKGFTISKKYEQEKDANGND